MKVTQKMDRKLNTVDPSKIKFLFVSRTSACPYEDRDGLANLLKMAQGLLLFDARRQLDWVEH